MIKIILGRKDIGVYSFKAGSKRDDNK